MPDSREQEIVFSFEPPTTMDGHIRLGHLTELMERGTTVVNEQIVTTVEDLRRCLRLPLLPIHSNEPS